MPVARTARRLRVCRYTPVLSYLRPIHLAAQEVLVPRKVRTDTLRVIVRARMLLTSCAMASSRFLLAVLPIQALTAHSVTTVMRLLSACAWKVVTNCV